MPLAFDATSDAIAKTSQFVQRAKAAILEAMGEAGEEVQEHTEELISIPVERDFSGQVTGRSTPGEAPRKDTGELQANLQHLVQRTEGGVEFVMMSERPSAPNVPTMLEDEMDRPYMGGQNPSGGTSSRNFAQEVIPEAVADKLRSLS